MAKTILITGATDGIGKLTAESLIAGGHIVLLHARNRAKLEATASEIGAETTGYVADLSDLNEVQAMAAEILGRHTKLDVLINNAGVLKAPVTQTEQGLDIRFAVNTLAPYVLTRQLLPIIPIDGRVVNLSSAAQAPVDLDALAGRSRLDDMAAYAQSKLAITMWTNELAREFPDGPAMISVNPGSLLATKMVKDGFGIPGKDLNIGADIIVRAALSEEFADASGRYFDNDSGQFANPHADALDQAECARVTRAVESLLT